MDICLLWLLCVVRWRSMRRADHSSRGVLPTVLRRCVWSRNIKKGCSMYIYDISRLRVNHAVRGWFKIDYLLFQTRVLAYIPCTWINTQTLIHVRQQSFGSRSSIISDIDCVLILVAMGYYSWVASQAVFIICSDQQNESRPTNQTCPCVKRI